MDKLTSLRDEIEKIDKKLTKLLIDRYKVVKNIGNLKEKYDIPIKHKDRELLILKMVKNHTKNDSIKIYLDKIFKYLFKISRIVQK